MIERWVMVALFAAFAAWVGLGSWLGGLIGQPEVGAVAAFWVGAAALAGLLRWFRRTPSGLGPLSLAGVGASVSAGLFVLALARLWRGLPAAEWLGPTGLSLVAAPTLWLGHRVLFGVRPEGSTDDLDL